MTTSPQPTSGAATPFASYAERYSAAGWRGVVPLPTRQKASPPDGFTGDTGDYPDPIQLADWVRRKATGNIGLRMNVDIVGIDVDDYDGKAGGTTFAQLIAELGPLPSTWTSTSRDDGVSGIRFFRLATPTKLIGSLKGIEFIQRHHRYAVAAPSIHPTTGATYRWISPDGEVGDLIPEVADLPLLPDSWLQYLRKDRTTTRQRQAMAVGRTEVAPAVDKAYGAAVRGLRQGTRHDSALVGATTLVRLAHLGFPGAVDTLEQLRRDFLAAVGDSRTPQEAEGEWGRIVASAQEVVDSTPSIAPRWEDRHSDAGPGLDDLIGPSLTGTPPATPAPAPTPDDPWPEPIPLGADSELPTFPAHILPTWIADYADEVADDLQVPIDLPATLALGALSTLAAGHLKVNVRGRWTEHVNLYLVVAMPPSTGKSPAYKAMCGPVTDLEAEYQRMVRADIAANADMVDALEGELKRTKALVDVKQETLAEIRTRLFTAQEKATTIPKFTVGDATAEALAKLIADNGGRIAIHSTEGGVFDLMAGRYSDRANLDIYLQAWSGDRLDTARIGREGNTSAEALLTMVLTVQPTVISALADRPELAGRGLTARFMYSIPPDVLGSRDLSLRPPPTQETRTAYVERLTSLGRRLLSWATPATLTMDPAAATHYTDWRQGLERRRTPGGDLRPMAEWTGKLESSVLRVAGLLHLAHGHEHHEPLDLTTMARAITLGEYWLAHAGHVHDLWGTSPDMAAARAVIEWARTQKAATFTVRQLYAANRARFPKADDTLPALTLLAERGWLRTVDGGPLTTQRAKRSVEVALHPEFSTVSARSARSVPIDKTSISLSLYTEEGEVQHGAQNAQNAQNDGAPPGSAPAAPPTPHEPDPWDLGLDEPAP